MFRMCEAKVLYAGEYEEDSFVLIDGLGDREERGEVLRILMECDKDFCPPLSRREGTSQKNLRKAAGGGVELYFEEMAGQPTLLWKRNGRVIAFLSFRMHDVCEEISSCKDVCYFTTICVRRSFRGQGLAAVLYHTAEVFIRKEYPDTILALRTWSTNEAQLHLMKKMGFEEKVVLRNDRGPGIDTIYFVKQ